MSGKRLFDDALKNAIKATLRSSWIISDGDAEKLVAIFANQLPGFQQHLEDIKKNSIACNIFLSYKNPDLTLSPVQFNLIEDKLYHYKKINTVLIGPWHEVSTEELIDQDNIKILPDFILNGQRIILKSLLENDAFDQLQSQLVSKLGKEFPTITPEITITIFNNNLFASFIELKKIFQENFLLSVSEIKKFFAPQLLSPYEISRANYYLNELYDIALTKKYDNEIDPQSFKIKYQESGLAALWDDDYNQINIRLDFSLLRSTKFFEFLLDSIAAATLSEQQIVTLKKSLQEHLLISESNANDIVDLFKNQLPALQEHINDIKRDYILEPIQPLILKYQTPALVITSTMSTTLADYFINHAEIVFQFNSMFRIDRPDALNLMTANNLHEMQDFIEMVKIACADAVQNKAFLIGLSHSIFTSIKRNNNFIDINYTFSMFEKLDDFYLPKLKEANDALENILLLTKQERIVYLSKLNVDQVTRLPQIIKSIKHEAMRRIQLHDPSADYTKFGVAILSPHDTHNFPVLYAPKFMAILLSLPKVSSRSATGQLTEKQISNNNEQLLQGFDRLAQGQPLGQLQLESLSYESINKDPIHATDVMSKIFLTASGTAVLLAVAVLWLRSLRNPTGSLALAQDVAMLRPGYNVILHIESQTLPELNLLNDDEIQKLKDYVETISDSQFKNTLKAKLEKYEDYLNDVCSISLTTRRELEDPVSVEILKIWEQNGIPKTSFYMSTYNREEFVLWLGSRYGATDPETRDSLIDNRTQLVKINRGFPNFINRFFKTAKNTLSLKIPVEAQHQELEIKIETPVRRKP